MRLEQSKTSVEESIGLTANQTVPTLGHSDDISDDGRLSKECRVCKSIFYKRSKRTLKEWETTKCCSRRCSAIHMHRVLAARRRLAEKETKTYCKVCRKLIKRRENEPLATYRQRKVCSDACRILSIKKQAQRRTQLRSTPKKCIACGKRFKRRANEQVSKFEERQTCGRKCTWKLKVVRPTKTCLACGKEFAKNKRDSLEQWSNRKVCSRKCVAKLARARSKYSHSKISSKKTCSPTKRCLVCGKKFSKRRKESITNFTSRKTCGMFCADELNSLHMKERYKKTAEQRRKRTKQWKKCRICESRFYRRENETDKEWKKHSYCSSTECRDRLFKLASARLNEKRRQRRQKIETKQCVICGKKIERRWGKESARRWKERQCCGRDCAQELGARTRRRQGLEIKRQCVICGRELPAGYTKRKLCGRLSCKKRLRRLRLEERKKNRPKKTCQTCGRIYMRPSNLSDEQWKKRSACSSKCVLLLKQQKNMVKTKDVIRSEATPKANYASFVGKDAGYVKLAAELVGEEMIRQLLLDQISLDSVLPKYPITPGEPETCHAEEEKGHEETEGQMDRPQEATSIAV